MMFNVYVHGSMYVRMYVGMYTCIVCVCMYCIILYYTYILNYAYTCRLRTSVLYVYVCTYACYLRM